jgi:hypothetical protein
LDPLLALKAVREVSLLADPERPEEVSQRAWDAAREQSEDYADFARAVRIAESMKRPWSEILAIAHTPEKGHLHQIKDDQSADSQDWLTEELVASMLAVVAHRLGKDSITFGEYDEERENILREDHKRWLHGRKILIPSARQIRTAVANKAERDSGQRRRTDKDVISMAGAWDIALEMAGLKPTTWSLYRPRRSLSIPEMLDRCYEAHGTEPTSHEIIVFARANEISYNQHVQNKPWQECVAEWKQSRRAQGLPVPDGPPPKGQRPDYSRDVGAARPGEQPSRNWSRVEDCIEQVVIYLRQLRPNERPTADNYDRWSKRHHAPATSVLLKHGGWAKLRALAQQQILREQRAARGEEATPTTSNAERPRKRSPQAPKRRRRQAAKKPRKRAPAPAKLAAPDLLAALSKRPK